MKHQAAALACLTLLTVTSAQADSASPTRSASSPVAAKSIGEFSDRQDFRRKYYVVPAGLSDAQLTALGRQLHAAEKNAWLWLLDSDEQAQQMMATVEKTQTGDMTGYPGQWVAQHTAAHSGLALMPKGGRQWLLYKGPYSSQLLDVLPCLDNKHKPGSRHHCSP